LQSSEFARRYPISFPRPEIGVIRN
jgi:hypothetical protein